MGPVTTRLPVDEREDRREEVDDKPPVEEDATPVDDNDEDCAEEDTRVELETTD